MLKTIRVLVWPGGAEIGLEIYRSLKDCKDIELYSAGVDIPNHAPYYYKNHFLLPSIKENDWLTKLNDFIEEHKIDCIFPAYDDIIVMLAKNAGEIKAKIISSPMWTCSVTRSKRETYLMFKDIIPTPKMYSDLSYGEYPIFLKPNKGQGSECTLLAEDIEQAFDHCKHNLDKDMLYLEYLPGKEYTVDCFTDRKKGLLFCGGRERLRMRSGISVAAKAAIDPAFREYAEKISKELLLYGAWFFQVKYNSEGVLTLLEIAPRIAGTMSYHRVQGLNFALLSIYEAMGYELEGLINPNFELEQSRCLTSSFKSNLKFDTVYVDFDDTLIIRDKVNTDLIKLIYQFINEGKSIILLTKHKNNIYSSLNFHHLNGIFDRVIQISSLDSKSKYIIYPNPILIDDSFSERSEVFHALGIPTFDCSMIEMLFDERA